MTIISAFKTLAFGDTKPAIFSPSYWKEKIVCATYVERGVMVTN